MEYTTAFAEDHVPSTGEYDPYMHVFLDAGNGNVLAFFELPNQKTWAAMRTRRNGSSTSRFKANTVDDALMAAKARRAEVKGLDVLGPTDHGIFKSIYFFDQRPSPRTHSPIPVRRKNWRSSNARRAADAEEWSRTKKPRSTQPGFTKACAATPPPRRASANDPGDLSPAARSSAFSLRRFLVRPARFDGDGRILIFTPGARPNARRISMPVADYEGCNRGRRLSYAPIWFYPTDQGWRRS